jgi:hypothetical protein
MPLPTYRTNDWLSERLSALCSQYFSDVTIPNRIFVRFGRKTKNRFGSILAKPHPAYDQPVTYITINGLFRTTDVPEYVIEGTLLHEFAHYTHGFHSPHPRKYTHPHRGNIVNKEIYSRGAKHIMDLQEAWIAKDYRTFLIKHGLL